MPHAPPQPLNRIELFRTLGYVPHPGQVEVHRSTAERRVVACGVRWGKSLCAAMEAIAAALAPCPYSVGWCVAPSYDLCDRIFREIQLAVFGKLRHRVISYRESDRRLLLRNMGGGVSEIRGKSADNPVSLLGEGLSWVIVDEAARLHPRIWEGYLSQRLLDRQGWALLISTPAGRGWFHTMYQRGQGDDAAFASWNNPTTSNPHIDPARVEAERALLPERVFRQEYLAEFIEGSGQVFRNVRECATGEWAEPKPEEIYVAGLDLAKVADFTVLTILDADAQVVFLDRFHRIDWSQQVGRVHTACTRYNDAHVLVDSTGAGEPVYESLCKAEVRVEGYKFSNASKAALIDNLALMLEQRRIVLPRPELAPELIGELEAFEFSVSDSGNVRTGAPGGQHDDCVISLALAAWQRRHGRPAAPLSLDVEGMRRAGAEARARLWLRYTGGPDPAGGATDLHGRARRGLMQDF